MLTDHRAIAACSELRLSLPCVLMCCCINLHLQIAAGLRVLLGIQIVDLFSSCFALMQTKFWMAGTCRSDPGRSQTAPRWTSGAESGALGREFLEGRRNKKASPQYIGWMTGFQSVVAVCFTGNLSCDKVGWVSVRLQESKNTPEKIRFDGWLLECCTLLLPQKSTRDLNII